MSLEAGKPKNWRIRGIFTKPEGQVIDSWLIARGSNVQEIQRRAKEELGIQISTKTLYVRKEKLLAAKQLVERSAAKQAQAEKEAEPKVVEEVVDEFLTIGKSLVPLIGAILPDDNPTKHALLAVQTQMESVLRRSKEFRDNFDHLSEMRWLLNMMEIRIAKMFELEMQMGVPMRDNTSNIQAMMTMIKDSIELHQSLGLKPKFGDPKLNVTVNIGATHGQEGTELQSERLKRLKALAAEYAQASDADKEAVRQRMLTEARLAHPVDTTFEVVKS